MNRSVVCCLATAILAVCLIAGGCISDQEREKLISWKDLLKLSEAPKGEKDSLDNSANLPPELNPFEETIDIQLYYPGPERNKLVMELRTIGKTEGIARKTIEELIKGPVNPSSLKVFPEGTRLLDINIKPDGRCIVDFSSEIRSVASARDEELMVYATVNTLGQFATVSSVEFMVNGQRVNRIAGYMDLSKPVEPDYTY